MKTKKTFISLFASLMFVSCNNESTPQQNLKEKVLYVTAYDLDKRKLFDIEVDTKTQVGVLTNIYTPEIQTRINGCNAAIYAAGVPWTIGFGMINPLAGVAAATFFWALEHAVC